jgi:hypothetical protein
MKAVNSINIRTKGKPITAGTLTTVRILQTGGLIIGLDR